MCMCKYMNIPYQHHMTAISCSSSSCITPPIPLQLLFVFVSCLWPGTLPVKWGGAMPSLRYMQLRLLQCCTSLAISLQLSFFVCCLWPGTLPAKWGGAMRKLRFLTLQASHLAGPIPGEYAGMNSLARLALDNNELTGAVHGCFDVWLLSTPVW